MSNKVVQLVQEIKFIYIYKHRQKTYFWSLIDKALSFYYSPSCIEYFLI